MLHAVIMAGGAGTRFWPTSRVARPKQLLDLAGERTMIQATVDRLDGLVASENILVVTNQRLVQPLRAQLPNLPADAIIGEPCKRDTAPCIGLAAAVVGRQDSDAIMAVMPADHVIGTDEQFHSAIRQAVRLVERQPSRIVTLGVRPSYPAESFGYIERGEPMPDSDGDAPAFAVARFREKPNSEVAREYVASGNFFWNSGIFIWKASLIEQALKEHEPEMAAHIATIAQAFGQSDFEEVFRREFEAIEGKSIDYAVMEHYQDVVVVEAPFRWDDVGSWGSLPRLHGADEQGNTAVGRHLGVNTTDSIIRSEGDHLVVTVGMRDCIVVHTPNATLVANRHDEEAIRQIVTILEERGWTEYL